jgi:hypothetical protein
MRLSLPVCFPQHSAQSGIIMQHYATSGEEMEARAFYIGGKYVCAVATTGSSRTGTGEVPKPLTVVDVLSCDTQWDEVSKHCSLVTQRDHQRLTSLMNECAALSCLLQEGPLIWAHRLRDLMIAFGVHCLKSVEEFNTLVSRTGLLRVDSFMCVRKVPGIPSRSSLKERVQLEQKFILDQKAPAWHSTGYGVIVRFILNEVS